MEVSPVSDNGGNMNSIQMAALAVKRIVNQGGGEVRIQKKTSAPGPGYGMVCKAAAVLFPEYAWNAILSANEVTIVGSPIGGEQ